MPKNDRPLGRGLGAMLGDMEIPVHSQNTQVVSGNTSIRIESIEANPYQPRTRFDEESLAELAQSIKRRVFHEMDNFKLSQKFHLRYFTLHVEELAEEAVRVADHLSIMVIKLNN